MGLNKVLNKNNIVDAGQNRSRALSLLVEEMSVLYPAPYYDIEAMVAEETKGFRSNRRSIAGKSGLSA